MKDVRRDGDHAISTFEEFEDGTCDARLFYRVSGRWQPPLPPDLEPIDAGEPSRSIARSSSEPRRPNWMLTEREPESWRL
jgi:hypothetical protein